MHEEFLVEDDSCPGCLGRGCAWCMPCPPRLWGSAEYLLWWRKGMNLPPLVTNNDPTPVNLFGGRRVGEGARPGGRLNLGYWFNACETCGVGGSFFALADQSASFDSRATGEDVVVRPFFQNGIEQVLVVNFPQGGVNGNVVAQTNSDVLGADVHFRTMIWRDCNLRVDVLAGYQTARIDEDLTIRHRFNAGGVDFDGFDRFATKNEFHGGQLGFLTQYRNPCWTVDFLAKVGLGNMHQTVDVSGSDVTGIGADASLLARQSNAGVRTRDEFTVAPELGINVAYHVSRCVDVTAGYSFLYWNHAVQPGDQIDLNLPNPQPLFNDSDYYVHGLNFGVNFRY